MFGFVPILPRLLNQIDDQVKRTTTAFLGTVLFNNMGWSRQNPGCPRCSKITATEKVAKHLTCTLGIEMEYIKQLIVLFSVVMSIIVCIYAWLYPEFKRLCM